MKQAEKTVWENKGPFGALEKNTENCSGVSVFVREEKVFRSVKNSVFVTVIGKQMSDVYRCRNSMVRGEIRISETLKRICVGVSLGVV